MLKRLAVLGALSAALLLSACSSESDDGIGSNDPLNTLQLNLQNLEALQNGYHYEGWAIVDGTPISTGRFNVDAGGALVDLDGNSIANNEFTVTEDLSDATDVVISIEPDGDSDPAPAATKYLGGAVSSLLANLSTAHPATLNSDYNSASGEFILATPTDGANNNETSGIWFLNPASTTFSLNFSGVEPLQNGYHYEGWAIVNGAPVSTGKFNIDGAGALVDLNGNDIANGEFTVGGDLSAATAIVLTIEPDGDVDDIPADTHYLAGDVSNNAASLTIGHGAALGDDFGTAAGDYILATPTTSDTTDENSGIWFLSLAGGSPAQGLTLPVLPAGWAYEGWVVIDGTPVSTGRFTDPAAADLDAPFSGTSAAPPFPGEDLVNNAPAGLTFPLDLAGRTAVISVEPSPDDSDAPFTFKPLAGAIPNDAIDHFTYSIDNNVSASAATGSVSITVSGTMAGLSLPTLPAGWEYEGWVVLNGTPLTTGKFLDIAAADLSAPFSGSLAGPPYPGEDFLDNAPAGFTFPVDLSGTTAVISIEPSPDDTPAPFTLKPLLGGVPGNAASGTVYSMDNNAATFPGGSATIK